MNDKSCFTVACLLCSTHLALTAPPTLRASLPPSPPAGEELHRVVLPVKRPTACTFGGDQLQHLYVTTRVESGGCMGTLGGEWRSVWAPQAGDAGCSLGLLASSALEHIAALVSMMPACMLPLLPVHRRRGCVGAPWRPVPGDDPWGEGGGASLQVPSLI